MSSCVRHAFLLKSRASSWFIEYILSIESISQYLSAHSELMAIVRLKNSVPSLSVLKHIEEC